MHSSPDPEPAPAARIPLCRLDALGDPDARGFEIPTAQGTLEVFVVRLGAELRAFRNRCPHTGVNLNWLPDRFFDAEARWLQCAMHGALFEPLSGECIHGSCRGRFLEPLSICVEAGQVWLEAARP